MIFSDRQRARWLPALPTASLLIVTAFAVGYSALVWTMIARSRRGPAGVGNRRPPRAESVGLSGAGAGADGGGNPDLEVPVVEVGRRGGEVVYRIGSREAGSPAALRELLEPLVRFGGAVSVRISHELPFARSAEAIGACRDAGFATIRLVPGTSGL